MTEFYYYERLLRAADWLDRQTSRVWPCFPSNRVREEDLATSELSMADRKKRPLPAGIERFFTKKTQRKTQTDGKSIPL